MRILITGGCKNGKSRLAQRTAVKLAGAGPLFYVATMIPRDHEDELRIKKHIADRSGMGFETIECGIGIGSLLSRFGTQAEHDGQASRVFLVDSLTALLANEMFRPDFSTDEAAAERCAADLWNVVTGTARTDSFIFVSDGIYSDAMQYGADTELFRRGLAYIERQLSGCCDIVAELCAGIPVVHKGKKLAATIFAEQMKSGRTTEHTMKNLELIIGGACQGKRSYAEKTFRLNRDDIHTCRRDSEPDWSCKCLEHIENYVYYCLETGRQPRTDCADGHILICDDIFCGIVPMSARDRSWREMTGVYLQQLAADACVTRVFCGRGEKLQ